jgi:enoyl-CoA hydratase/carnithine racemase
MSAANPVTLPLANYQAKHVRFEIVGKVATLTLDRPDKKNPLTFDSYAEVVNIFRAAARDKDLKVIVVAGAGGNFSSGGDVFEIIGPLIEMDTVNLLDFTRMTGEVVKAMRACPQPIIAAIDGVCAGAGAAVAMACDIRIGTPEAKIAFLFNRVGLAGCDMGACAMLPRIIGQGRAAELLYTGRTLGGEEAERWGFFNRLATSKAVVTDAQALAAQLAAGPTFGNAMTKRMLEMEWAMSVETAIEAEAVAQALCMETQDFRRAFQAFANKQKPVFEGN